MDAAQLTAPAPITVPAPAGASRWSIVARDYLELTKPKVQSLLLLTTVTTMYVAGNPGPRPGAPDLPRRLPLGGRGRRGQPLLGSRHRRADDAHRQPARTRGARLAAGGAPYGLLLRALSFVELSLTVNVLAASLALCGFVGYVGVYTIWLKRRTPQNIVIGGAAGAVPPLVGWAAVDRAPGPTALYLFVIVFLWTPASLLGAEPADEGRVRGGQRADAPGGAGRGETRKQIVLYAVLIYAVSELLYCAGRLGVFYMISSTVLGALFVAAAIRLYRRADRRSALRLYLFSLAYLALLFGAMVVDTHL